MSAPVEYRDVAGFTGYRVGDDGSVWSCRPRGGWTKPTPWHRIRSARNRFTGYLTVPLSDADGVSRRHLVHIIALEAFHGPRPPGLYGRHKNGDKTDNRAVNLAWMKRRGVPKLDACTVYEMREIDRQGEHSLAALARMFGVTTTTVAAVLRGLPPYQVERIDPGLKGRDSTKS